VGVAISFTPIIRHPYGCTGEIDASNRSGIILYENVGGKGSLLEKRGS
jgi:hypothetical protein